MFTMMMFCKTYLSVLSSLYTISEILSGFGGLEILARVFALSALGTLDAVWDASR